MEEERSNNVVVAMDEQTNKIRRNGGVSAYLRSDPAVRNYHAQA
jgi:hypothetical protein